MTFIIKGKTVQVDVDCGEDADKLRDMIFDKWTSIQSVKKEFNHGGEFVRYIIRVTNDPVKFCN